MKKPGQQSEHTEAAAVGGSPPEPTKELVDLFQRLWRDYCALSPQAVRIHQLLTERGEVIINDHIALRTFRSPNVGIERVARPFERMGYRPKQDYVFEQKKLYAKHWEHEDASLPKIFISELEVEKLTKGAQEIIDELISQIPGEAANSPEFFVSGRPWKVSYETYLKLAAESEYASWVAAFGFRPNHFTVSVNHLKTFRELDDLNAFLKLNGYQLNSSGGEIKGTPSELLEQSSTVAEEILTHFSDVSAKIPTVYYEFARRYPTADGKLYTGFIAKSADKIFESTDRKSAAPKSRP